MIRAFLDWWLGQLAELLPAPLRRTSMQAATALVIAPSGPLEHPTCVAMALRRRGKEVPLGEFAANHAKLNEFTRSNGRLVVLRLPKREVLEKTLVLPLAAQSDLDQVLTFEMDRETPFKPEELYWSRRVAGIDRERQQFSVRLFLLPKAKLAPLLAVLGGAGVVPNWAEIEDGSEGCAPLPLEGEARQLSDRSRRLLWPAAACCGFLAVSAVVLPFVQQASRLATLDREIEKGRAVAARADALHSEIDRFTRGAELVGNELDKVGKPLEIMAKMTQLLPDDTYLTDFQLRQGKLTINGRSGGAARLIGTFAADQTFRNPAFAAPVTRIDAMHAEVFAITADVRFAP
jgi:general secretion pathway protein L